MKRPRARILWQFGMAGKSPALLSFRVCEAAKRISFTFSPMSKMC
jgi:hypothetical protein